MQDIVSPNPDALLPWQPGIAPFNNHHNVRAICDSEGLTYKQKEVLTACVYQESEFDINAKNENWVLNTSGQRYIASTDWGIVQINDFYHIGAGKDFPSVSYVLSNPEQDVRFMCRYYKRNGHLKPWVSYTSGAYKQWLGKV